MFGDLDWPLNASRGFVSISRASCFHLPMQLSDLSQLSYRQVSTDATTAAAVSDDADVYGYGDLQLQVYELVQVEQPLISWRNRQQGTAATKS